METVPGTRFKVQGGNALIAILYYISRGQTQRTLR